MKNPLNAFLAFADILEQFDEYSPEEHQELLKQFRLSAEHLFALLENLLTWARSQQGRLPYRPQTLGLTGLLSLTFAFTQSLADNKQIRLIAEIPPDLSVIADLDMLGTVLRNLLTNAIKFTPTGGSVTISARPAAGGVEISVSDTGIGISKEKAAELFQLGAKHRQLGTAGERGTGLGLILCKEFVEFHGGTICCESVEGQGSTFRVMLPTPPADAPQ